MVLEVRFLSVFACQLIVGIEDSFFTIRIYKVVPMSVYEGVFGFLSIDYYYRDMSYVMARRREELYGDASRYSVLCDNFGSEADVRAGASGVAYYYIEAGGIRIDVDYGGAFYYYLIKARSDSTIFLEGSYLDLY